MVTFLKAGELDGMDGNDPISTHGEGDPLIVFEHFIPCKAVSSCFMEMIFVWISRIFLQTLTMIQPNCYCPCLVLENLSQLSVVEVSWETPPFVPQAPPIRVRLEDFASCRVVRLGFTPQRKRETQNL